MTGSMNPRTISRILVIAACDILPRTYSWVEKIFGHAIVNSDGKSVPVRYIGELYVREDLGSIPSFQDRAREMHIQPWMYGQRLTPGKNSSLTNVEMHS